MSSVSKQLSGILTAYEYNILKVIDSVFKNSSSLTAGGMYFDYLNQIFIFNSTFESIQATYTGGLFKISWENKIKISESNITYINNQGDGNVFYLSNGNYLFVNLTRFNDCYFLADFLYAWKMNFIQNSLIS